MFRSTRSLFFLIALILGTSSFCAGSAFVQEGVGSSQGSSSSIAKNSKESRRLSAEAKDLVDQYDGSGSQLETASEKLKQALSFDTGNADAYIEMARIAMKSQWLSPVSLSQAEEFLRKGLALEPSHGNSYVLLGYVLVHQKRYDLAAKAFEDAHKFKADSPWLAINEAELASQKDDSALILRKNTEVVNDSRVSLPLRVEALEALARQYAEQGDIPRARETYQQIFELIPDNALLMGNFSRLLRVQALDVKESEVWGRRALKKMDYPWGRVNLGSTLYLKWAETFVVEKNQAKADAIFSEAKSYVSSPAEVLHEIDSYPRAHPIINALVAKGYSLDKFEDISEGGSTPLTEAAKNRNLAVVDGLLKAGANPNVPGFAGVTALMFAVTKGDEKMVRLLLRSGADPSLRAADGSTAEKLVNSSDQGSIGALLANAKAKQANKEPSSYGLRMGYIYRSRSKTDVAEYGYAFEDGEELVYLGRGDLLDEQGGKNTKMIGHHFRSLTQKVAKVWAQRVEDGDDAWMARFELVGPYDRAEGH